MNILSNDELHRYAPSIFANDQHASRSMRYQYVPTIDLINGLAKHGWQVTEANEQIARRADQRGYTKHLIKLQNVDLDQDFGTVPQLVIINSHNGSSSYQMRCGFYRFVCSNGLIVGDDVMPTLRIRHTGEALREVIEGSYKVINEVPRLSESIQHMRALELNSGEKLAFADAALVARFGENIPIRPDQLLTEHRSEDQFNDLWTVFNTIQENITKGGMTGRDANGSRRRVREVKSIDGNTKLNQALWTLAENMRKLKMQ